MRYKRNKTIKIGHNILFWADKGLFDRLDDFRFNNRIRTQSAAIRRLLDEALKKYEHKSKSKVD